MTDPEPDLAAANPAPALDSLFSADTIEGLRAARLEAVNAARAGDARAESALHACERVAAAVAAADAGKADEARRMLDEVLANTTDLRLLFLGYQFHFRLAEYDEAERIVRRRLQLASPDSADAARAWNNLGLIFHFRGDHDNAEAMMQRALEIDTRIGCEEGVARDLGNMSLIPEARGDFDMAERLLRESMAIGERIGLATLVAGKLCNLGEIAIARGRRDEARDLLMRAESAFRALKIEKHRSHCERLIGELDKSQGR